MFFSSGITPQSWGVQNCELRPTEALDPVRSREVTGVCPRCCPRLSAASAGRNLKARTTCSRQGPFCSPVAFPSQLATVGWTRPPGYPTRETNAEAQSPGAEAQSPGRIPPSPESIFPNNLDGLRESPAGSTPAVPPSLPAWVNRSHPGCSPPPP